VYRDALKDKQRSRFLAVIVGASLLAGCQPGGIGSITLDGKDPAIRSLKTLEDGKAPKKAKASNKPAGTKSVPRAGFQ
jgi:hypothetical protein